MQKAYFTCMSGKLYVGLSGYSYKPWQGEGRFYPAELKQREFLWFYSQHYNAVEMDGTWYRMPSEKAVEDWIAGAPEGFKYTFKAHRSITHIKRLNEESFDSITFMKGRVEPVLKAGKLGTIFFQCPPSFKRNDKRLLTLLEWLPKDHPWAIEFRNTSWNVPEVEEMLRAHNVAWVAWDTDEEHGQRRDTGPFYYARLRRENYSDEELAGWADWFRGILEKGKDCYVFIKHEDEGSPWVDANRLLAMMK